MTSQMINTWSKNRFGELMSAVNAVGWAMDQAIDLVDDYDEEGHPESKWTPIPSEEEMRKMRRDAADALVSLHVGLTRVETKLIANGWRI